MSGLKVAFVSQRGRQADCGYYAGPLIEASADLNVTNDHNC